MSKIPSIKDCLCSRFEGGRLIEIDYSQLEVVGAAVVSGDPMMKKDILDGVDSHSQSAAWLNPQHSYAEIRNGYLGEDPYFTKLRKSAKAPRFELQYGAGATSIARNNGLSKDVAQGFIDRYYDRYSVLKDYQDEVMEYLNTHPQPTTERSKGGIPLCKAQWQSETGRIYTFKQHEAPEWLQKRGTMSSFSPTQAKNYPMQGFATGDVMLHMIGKLPKLLYDNSWHKYMLPIATIHDSVVLDWDVYGYMELPDANAGWTGKFREFFSSAPQEIEEHFGIDFRGLPLNIDIEVGERWSEMSLVK